MQPAPTQHGRNWQYIAVLTSFILATTALADDSPALQQGAQLLQPFKQQLQQALKTGLADGPAAAIDACRLQAPSIAAGLSTDYARVGRSSHKLRNPANAPEPWVRLIMTGYLNQRGKPEPVAVRLDNGRIGYVEPIILQPMCTTCHGDSLSEPVARQISELYPEDAATGFKEGDLRGVFWAEFNPIDPQ